VCHKMTTRKVCVFLGKKEDSKHKVVVEIRDRESAKEDDQTMLKKAILEKLCSEQRIQLLGLKNLDSVSNVPWLDQVGIFWYDEDFEDEVLMDSDYIVPNRAKNIFVRVLVPQKGNTSHTVESFSTCQTDNPNEGIFPSLIIYNVFLKSFPFFRL
jgi:hypothetical protein